MNTRYAREKAPAVLPVPPICHFVIRGICATATATATMQLYQDQVVGVPAPALRAEKGHLLHISRDKGQHQDKT